MKAKVALISNTAWYIYNFRAGLIRKLQQSGYAVLAIAPDDEYAQKLEELGATFRAAPMDNKGTNPLRDLRLLFHLRRLLKRERVSCALTFTVKPNIFGAFAAASLGIPAISNISGLGTVFIKRTWVTSVVRLLYHAALSLAAKVFFQNPEDLQLFVRKRLVSPSKAALLPGSGVDLQRFAPQAHSDQSRERFRFLLHGRLLWDKGIGEYVEAAALVKSKHPDCEFFLMGFLAIENSTAIPLTKMEEWQAKGLVTYMPPVPDVRVELAKADCVVLPSYREGTPKALLEASSMAIPVIATDVPGCRQVVEDRATGLLVKVRDASDLAEKMQLMLGLSASERRAMGMRGRQRMALHFDERVVQERYMQALGDAIGNRQTR